MLHKSAPIDFHCKCIIVALIFAYFYVQIEESKLFFVLLNIVTYAADWAKLEVNPICSCNIKIDSAVDSWALTKSVGFPPEGSAWRYCCIGLDQDWLMTLTYEQQPIITDFKQRPLLSVLAHLFSHLLSWSAAIRHLLVQTRTLMTDQITHSLVQLLLLQHSWRSSQHL